MQVNPLDELYIEELLTLTNKRNNFSLKVPLSRQIIGDFITFSGVYNKLGCILIRQMKYIYIDESINDHASLASLIAMEFDSKYINQVTKDFYDILKLVIDKFPKEQNGTKLIQPTPILHGCNFLRNSKDNKHLDFTNIEDEFRFEILNLVVDLVNKFNLKIVRVGYSNYNELKAAGFPDDKMYGTNWMALLKYFKQVDTGEEYMFIMDGTTSEMIGKLSTFIRDAKSHFYIYGMKESLIIPNVDRFINNVFYVPLKFCEPLQIVDMISYLLQKKDYVNITGRVSEFSGQLIEISERINNELVINSIIKMNYKKQ